MKTRLTLILMSAALGLTFPAVVTRAQDYVPTPVTISQDKVRRGDAVCYAHVVLEKQTLFSIAQAYGVTVDELYAFNPAVKDEGLKTGSILYIPVKDEAVYHTVRWNDTLWSISQEYGVSMEAIIEANHLDGTKIKKKQKLLIPIGEKAEATEQTVTGTDENEITTKIDAPEGQEITEGEDNTIEETGPDPDDPEGWVFTSGKDEVSIALLLPFTSGGKRSASNIDFYCGFLLALGDLKDKGITTDLEVHDVSGDAAVDGEKLTDKDIVIGPLSPEAVKKELARSDESTWIFSPLNQKVLPLAEGRSRLIQAPVPLTDQYEDLVTWLSEEFAPGDNILLISDKNAEETEFSRTVKKALSDHNLRYKSFSYVITQGRTISGSIAEQLSKEAANHVIVLSTTEAFLGDAIRNLNVLSRKKYDITLYAPSKVREFDTTIESEYLHNLKLHMTASYNIDYGDRKVMDFILRDRALYNTEPTKMAFQGYDTAYYMISMLSTYGIFYRPFMLRDRYDLLQSSFRFEKTDGGSLVNHAVRRVLYETDFTIRQL